MAKTKAIPATATNIQVLADTREFLKSSRAHLEKIAATTKAMIALPELGSFIQKSANERVI
jgi:hypothetical protein